MITVIAGTNRRGSKTKQVAQHYYNLIQDSTEQLCKILFLEDVPDNFVHNLMYEKEHQNPGLAKIQDDYFTPASKLVFVVPEYNGSYPGIFKIFIDAISIRNYKENFAGKKVALIGVASGRGGNLRGLDHLTTSLNYLKMNVFPNRLPIAKIEDNMDSKGAITDKSLASDLKAHATNFLNF